MANILTDIRTGFFTKLLTGTTSFKSAIDITVGLTTFYRLWYDEAPQVYAGTTTHVEPPWVTFSILPVDEDRDSCSKFYSCTVQFTIAALSVGECETIAGYLTALLDDCEASLSIGAYRVLDVRRQSVSFQGKLDNVYSIIVQYSLLIER